MSWLLCFPNIYGGEIFVNNEADGLDANGNIIIYGGNISVLGAKSNSDRDPINMEGSLTISGGTIYQEEIKEWLKLIGKLLIHKIILQVKLHALLINNSYS